MATKIGQELVEFTFGLEKTDMGNGLKGFDPKNLDRFTKAVEAYEREFKRVFGSMVSTTSEIIQSTGQALTSVFIPKMYEREALGVRDAINKQMFGSSGKMKDLMWQGTSDAHFLETTREIKGAKAQQFAKESVIEAGGKIIHTPNTANKDMMTTFIPISDNELNAMSKKEIANYVRGVTPESNSASRAEATERARQEREAQMERDAKRQQAHFRDLKKQNEKRQHEQERQQKQELKEAEQAEKDKVASRKQTLGRIGKIVALITGLVDITRRILTSVLNFGSEYSKTATKAGTLNIGAQDIRNLNYLDKAMGLEAGTNVQMQEDIRKAFGNTANINTEALKWLSMVMGNEAGDLVRSGIGGDNPAYFAERIIDAFFKRQQEGVDQYGNKVGQDKARRSLVTLLESVSPAIARTFERMVEEQATGLHAGEITSYRQFQNFYTPSQGSTDALDWERLSKFGKEVDLLKAEFSNLVTLLKVKVADALTGFITNINKLNIGKNVEEVTKDRDESYKRLASWREGYSSRQQELRDKLNKRAQGAGFKTIDDVINSMGSDNQAEQLIYEMYGSTDWSDLMHYLALDQIIADIQEQEGLRNPNASASIFGDTGYADYVRKVLTTNAVLSQMSNPWEITFNPSDFVTQDGENGITKLNRITSEALAFGDYIPSKQGLVRGGALNFFDIASDGGAKSYYGETVLKGLKKYAKIKGGVNFGKNDKEKWNKFMQLYKEAEELGWNTESGKMLLDFFAFLTGDASGLDSRRLAIVRNAVRSAEDEYGLSPLEYKNVDEMRTLGMERFKDFAWDRITVSQGNTAGTLNINFEQTLNGTVIDRKSLPASGNMTGEKDITFATKATVNEANEVVGR